MVNRIPIKEGHFIEGAEDSIILANRCKLCSQIFFPKVVFCLSCFNEDMEELRLSRRGILYSYTIGHMPSMHFEPPYAIGYVDMPEGVRIFTPLKILENKPLKVGMTMELVIEKIWQEGDSEIIGYKFIPV